jgi:hypothetical protein
VNNDVLSEAPTPTAMSASIPACRGTAAPRRR